MENRLTFCLPLTCQKLYGEFERILVDEASKAPSIRSLLYLGIGYLFLAKSCIGKASRGGKEIRDIIGQLEMNLRADIDKQVSAIEAEDAMFVSCKVAKIAATLVSQCDRNDTRLVLTTALINISVRCIAGAYQDSDTEVIFGMYQETLNSIVKVLEQHKIKFVNSDAPIEL